MSHVVVWDGYAAVFAFVVISLVRGRKVCSQVCSSAVNLFRLSTSCYQGL